MRQRPRPRRRNRPGRVSSLHERGPVLSILQQGATTVGFMPSMRIESLFHSHLEFRFLMLTLALILTFLVLFGWICWWEDRRGKAPKYSKRLRRRLQRGKRKLKRNPNDPGRDA